MTETAQRHVRSYSSIKALPHNVNRDLFLGRVVVQEKVDGSQFSFVKQGDDVLCRTRNTQLSFAPEATGMFQKAAETVYALADKLTEGYTYRCEYLCKRKHNALEYDRVPAGYLVLYDVDAGHEAYLSPEFVRGEARRLGLEPVVTFVDDEVDNAARLRELLGNESALGGAAIEGIVVKNYSRYAPDGHVLMGKLVREDFVEVNKANWRKTNPTGKDIVYELGESLRTEARWRKAIQHLREGGMALTNSPQDIGPLLTEISRDILEEEGAAIREALFKWAWKDIHRMVTRGFPEWYKQEVGC